MGTNTHSTTNDQRTQFDVRIQQHLVDGLHDGELTPSMLLTMVLLHNWADWSTGRVKHCSAGGLHTWSRRAYSVRTFQDALSRLEELGHITRHIVRGSHDDYAVSIHNYKHYDDAGKVHILNPKPIRTWQEIKSGRCTEAVSETVSETSEKVLSLDLSLSLSENDISTASENDDQRAQKALRMDGEESHSLKYGNTPPSHSPSSNHQNKVTPELNAANHRVWDYYITATGKDPEMNSFTDSRKKKGLARLRECLGKTGNDLGKAEQLMQIAVDALVASDWHTGRDPKTGGKQYIEWENHLFKNYERMERWWNAAN